MSDLASSANKMNDIETAAEAPVSEATEQKAGSSINYLLDQMPRITALENRVEGAASGPGTGALISLTVTLDATDFVELTLSSSSSAFGTSTTPATMSNSGTLAFTRNGSTLVSSANTILQPGVFIDKPGAGTFTYALTSGAGFGGNSAIKIVRG